MSYQCLYLQVRGELRTQLTLALRQGRTRRVSRSRTTVARERFFEWSTSANARSRPSTPEASARLRSCVGETPGSAEKITASPASTWIVSYPGSYLRMWTAQRGPLG